MQLTELDPNLLRMAVVLALVTLPIKGLALWKSAQRQQKGWYITMLLLNTLGILELVYLFYFSKYIVKEDN